MNNHDIWLLHFIKQNKIHVWVVIHLCQMLKDIIYQKPYYIHIIDYTDIKCTNEEKVEIEID